MKMATTYFTQLLLRLLGCLILVALLSTYAASLSPTAISGSYLTSQTLLFLPSCDTSHSSGNLAAYKIPNHAGDFGKPGSKPEWKAAGRMPLAADRRILSARINSIDNNRINKLSPIEFNWKILSIKQQSLLQNNPLLLDFLRGDQSEELSNGGIFRNRTTPLGDIIHSAPVYVAARPAFNYPDTDYAAFRNSFDPEYGGTSRPAMIYLGANDGMLHGFTASDSGGKELFGYVPYATYPDLHQLSHPDYQTRPFVDGSAVVVDAKITRAEDNAIWQTVLASSLGMGGKAIFALNVSRPSADLKAPFLPENRFLWEVSNQFPMQTNRKIPMYPDLGHLLTRPSIIRVRMQTGNQKWLLVAPNGVLSDSGKTVLYVINLTDGMLYQQISVGNEGNSGMTSATAVDMDNDTYTDRIYASDLQGNIWRFDWNQAHEKFQSKFTNQQDSQPLPLFRATRTVTPKNTIQANQAITSELNVGVLPVQSAKHGIMIYFGAGQETQIENTQDRFIQATMYAILDNSVDFNLDKNDLLKQTLQQKKYRSKKLRVSSARQIDRNEHHGWFIDLPDPDEHITVQPQLLRDRVLFVSRQHIKRNNTNAQSDGGSGWIMEFQSASGSRPQDPVFDLNEDGEFDEDDQVDNIPVSGVQPPSGAPVSAAISRQFNPATGKLQHAKYFNTTSGEIIHLTSPADVIRKSWRRISH